ncbi:unnamed protein product [Camellia sinensis]
MATNDHCNYFRWFTDDDDDDDDITASTSTNAGPRTDSTTEEINDLRRRVGEHDRRLQKMEKMFKSRRTCAQEVHCSPQHTASKATDHAAVVVNLCCYCALTPAAAADACCHRAYHFSPNHTQHTAPKECCHRMPLKQKPTTEGESRGEGHSGGRTVATARRR